jgi:hypothetical protein
MTTLALTGRTNNSFPERPSRLDAPSDLVAANAGDGEFLGLPQTQSDLIH